MSPAETLAALALRGFRFEVRGEGLRVAPMPDAATIADLRTKKAELRALVAESGGRWPPLATAHRYVVWRGAVDGSRSVCLSCGVPPGLHGAGALSDPLVVDDPNDAVLRAAAIVAIAAAGEGL